jgi:hypothetical protein
MNETKVALELAGEQVPTLLNARQGPKEERNALYFPTARRRTWKEYGWTRNTQILGGVMNEATFEARLNAELQRIFPTLTKLNVSHQDIFTLHFGRKLITINGKENDKVFGRYDVLIEIEGKPLILFELKRPGIDLFAEDRDQGISYARLLDPMPPLVIVSNGQKTEFYTTCDKKPWVTNSYDENALRALVEHALSAAAAEKDESVRLLLGQQPKIWTDIIRQFTSDKLIGRQGDLKDLTYPLAKTFSLPRKIVSQIADMAKGGNS